MKLLIAIVLTLSLTGCANMEYRSWKPGQKFGLTWSTNSKCGAKVTVNKSVTYNQCF